MLHLYPSALLVLWLWFACFGKASGQCSLVPVDLARRVEAADLIAEGWISDLRALREPESDWIYTYGKLELATIFKGNRGQTSIWLAVPGGQIDLEIHRMSPGIELSRNQSGLFLLAPTGRSYQNLPVYEPVAYSQGILYYEAGSVVAPFDRFESPAQLIQTLTQTCRLRPAYIQELPARHEPQFKVDPAQTMSTPVITTLIPGTITAGTGSVLTIVGSNFGRSPAFLGRVNFANADNGGQGFISASNTDIRFWSDTRIDVVVPSRAGTGRVQVVNSSGQTATSAFNLNITFAVLNYTNFFSGVSAPADLINQNGQGGISFQMAPALSQNPAAVAALRRALETWRCGTGVNFSLSNQPASVSCSADDGINLINYDTQCRLSQGVLAATFSRISGCFVNNVLFWQVKDLDLLFNSQINWHFGPSQPTWGRFDFESVAVHELGHAHQLGHIVAPGRVMHFAIGPNQEQRQLNFASDIGGGQSIMQRSESRSLCGTQAMRRVPGWQCRLEGSEGLQPPVPNFQVDRTRGCAPLRVQFLDLSTNNPTSWEWDIDNDGRPDHFIANPAHTYLNPGTYSVRLTARNAAGAASTVRWFLIQVDAGGPLNLTPIAATVCQGSTVSLTASGAQSYAWSPVLSASASSSIYTFVPAASQTFTVTGFYANGCTSTRTVPVNVLPLPQLQVSSSPASSPQSANGSLSVSPSGGQAPYLIRLQNGPFSSQTIFTGLLAGTYSLAVRDANGCENQATAQVGIAQATACATPTQLTASNLTASSAFLSWANVAGASSYRLFFRRSDDANFQVLVLGSPSFNLTGLQAGTAYQWYVQAVCGERLSDGSGLQSFTTQSTAPAACVAPVPQFSEITPTSLRVSWPQQPNALSWQVYYRPLQASAWNFVSVFAPATSVVLTGLSAATRYEVYLRTECVGQAVSSFGGPYFAETAGQSAPACTPPASVSVSPFGTGAFVSWSSVAGATTYRLTWRETSSLNSVTAFVQAPQLSYTIQNLLPARSYELSISTTCGGVTSSNRSTWFNTPPQGKLEGTDPWNTSEWKLYPNPGTGRFSLLLPADWNDDELHIEITDLQGKRVYERLHPASTQGHAERQVEIEGLAAGVYVVMCRTATRTAVLKWVGL